MRAKFLLVNFLFIAFANLNLIASKQDPKNWWKTTVIYQIYPRSFMDSNADGIGDLNGITSKLDYLAHLGVDTVWLSPIYKSPMKDFGYDVSDYISIEPMFGTMDDFSNFLNASKSLGIKVIMDFVPNHSSDKHPWFIKSEAREEPFTDYYVWEDGKLSPNGTHLPPNNWVSVFGGSMWEWNEKRQQFYLHQFLKEQPDLNFRNHRVRNQMKEIVHFWLEFGIDGLRVDAPKHMFEDPSLRDEPKVSWETNLGPDEYGYYDHIYTIRDPEIFTVLAEWREVFNKFEEDDGFHRLMMVESVENINYSLPYFGNESFTIADMPFNFALFTLHPGFNGFDLYNAINDWQSGMPEDKWSNWILGNHDNKRIGNRTQPELTDAFNMLCLLLRGTPITYYGEEIGMLDTFIAWEDIQDPNGAMFGPDRYTEYNRDPERTPMQWDSTRFSGFTTGNKTWLPVNDNYEEINVEAQKDDPRSHLNIYRRLIEIKKEQEIINGSLDYLKVTNEVFAFSRMTKYGSGIGVVINVSNATQVVNIHEHNPKLDYVIPDIGTLLVASNEYPMKSDNNRIDLSFIELPPYQAVVVKFSPYWT